MAKAAVFEETYHAYVEQIGTLALPDLQDILGFEMEGDHAVIPLYNTRYVVSSHGIVDGEGQTARLSECVILSKYLLMCPEALPAAGGLAAFKDFKDAAPLIHFFNNSVQGDVARAFSGKIAALNEACERLGGVPVEDDWSYQIKYRFAGLPRVSVYLLFNDEEEGFPAQCTLLFDRSTEAFLDMESVAMLAGTLSRKLVKLA